MRQVTPTRVAPAQMSAQERLEARRARRAQLAQAQSAASMRSKEVSREQKGTASDGKRIAPGGKIHSVLAPVKTIIIAIIGIAIAFVLAILILWNLPIFTITSIDAASTEHISADAIAKLADVTSGTTLINVDVSKVAANVKKNPWAAQVSVDREFPNKLSIRVTERKASMLVLMNSADIAWYLGDDGVWIEPVNISTQGFTTAENAALQQASNQGCLLVTSVPSTVSPAAASKATDSSILGIQEYLKAFTEDFAKQIVSFSAASTDSLTCTLSNGVEVSLGAPQDIETKEKIINQLLAQHPNQITYINVRVSSNPTYRKVGVESVQSGTGARVTEQNQAATTAASQTDSNTAAPQSSQNSTQNTAANGT